MTVYKLYVTVARSGFFIYFLSEVGESQVRDGWTKDMSQVRILQQATHSDG